MKKDMGTKPQQTVASPVPLAIVGLGCLFPKAENVAAYWANIKQGVDAIREVPASHWRAEDYFDQDPKAPDRVYAKQGGFLDPVEFNPMEYGILPNALEATDTSQLLGLVAVGQALEDAGYGPEREYDRDRVSVIIGVTGTLELVIPLGARLGHPRWKAALAEAGVPAAQAADAMARIADSYVPWQENSFPGLLGNVVAGRISRHFNFGGTNCVVDAACGSSLSALNLAALELAAGKADMVVTGGIDTFNDIFMYTCFSKTPALSPSGHAKPFADDADGTTLGEGLGILVLKRLADAERDGDKIYAVVKGLGSSSDGRGAAIYEPNAAGQQKALLRAYEQSGVNPASIELIEAHGTGTKVGDAVEVKALRAVFGEGEQPWCALGSVKSQIGHTKAAAGSAGLIKAALALHHKVLPASIKVKQPQAAVTEGNSPFYLNAETRPWLSRGSHPRRAGVSALGFGGSNFHCLLEEYQPQKSTSDWSGEVQLLTFSAADETSLAAALAQLPSQGSWIEVRSAARQSRAAFDPTLPCRLALVAEKERTNLPALVKSALTLLEQKAGQTHWNSPDGAYFGRGPLTGKTAVLFPGQGAQYPGMLRDLALHSPALFAELERADGIFAAAAGRCLSEVIYPRPAFSSAAQEAQAAALRATEVAQPALGAVSLGALDLLGDFGFAGDAFAGHSYGELAALCAAGCFDRETLHGLSHLRGRLMAAGEGDRGSMLAVAAPLEQVAEIIAAEGLDLVLANKNTPQQGVLSGASSEIARAAEVLQARGLRVTPLAVAAAFHSALVAPAAVPFAERLQQVAWQPAQAPVFANRSGAPYPLEADAARTLLAEQLASPVEFVRQIEAMHASGIRTFVEVGPGARLTGMVKAILGDKGFQALALDASAGKRSGSYDLARTLAQLAVSGHALQLSRWDEGFVPPAPGKKPGLTVQLTGANYFKAPAKRPALPPQPLAAPVAAPPSPAAVAPAPVAAAALPEMLQFTQQSLLALQQLQEQTARLHQQFLAGQETTARSFMALAEQQRQLLSGPPLAAPAAVTPVVAAPVPSVVAAVPAAPAPVVAAAAPTPSSDKVAKVLLAVIAEKTGYPQEMLELEMTLDSDLGIDSIKRVEILSALQERLPEAPAVRPEQLGYLQTLGQIVAHLAAGMAASVSAGPAIVAPAAVAAPAAAAVDQVAAVLLAVIAEKTGYPQEMLELEMTLDSDLGIDSIKRVEILSALQERLPEAPAVRPEQLGSLQTLGQIVAHLSASMAGSAPATAPAVPPAPVLAGAVLPAEKIAAVLLAVIAEKTGYPQEMLELEMALDSDLGIDSIKRVEILSALQERLPEAPTVRPEQLGSLQTLGQIVAHLAAGSASAAAAPAAPVATASSGKLDRSAVAAALLGVIADKTGYPVEMLELEMALDSDLGIDSIKRVEILSALQERLPGAPPIKPEHLGTLQTVGQIVDFLASVSGAPPAAPAPTALDEELLPGAGVERKILKVVPLPAKDGRTPLSLPAGTQVWVSADGSELSGELCAQLRALELVPSLIEWSQLDSLTPPLRLGGLLIPAPAAGSDDGFLTRAFHLVQLAAPALTREPGSLLATVSRLNGRFGLLPGDTPVDPVSGGLAGLCKTAGHEWPQLRCKALDLAADLAEPALAAKAIIAEMFTEGPAEVGLCAGGLHALKLSEVALTGEARPLPLQPGEVVVISGGGRGVTAEVAVALAGASRATLLLLGRSPAPVAEPAWLAGVEGEGALKQALLAHAAAPLKPKDVEIQYRQLLGNRELAATIARIQALGGKALYRSVDLRDETAVAAVIAEVRSAHGPIRGLLHGAGVLADRLIGDKTLEQFEQVYSTKIAGLRALLAAVRDDALKFMALFSSSTGRFGRTGQVDYAVANEVLNKLAQQQARLRPQCRVVSLNWGPWDGGMVTPALKKIFQQEGVAVIGLQAGAAYLLQELATPPGGPVELVILGAKAETQIDSPAQTHQNICVSKAFDLDLSVGQYPFLKSHVLDTKAVLPMAMIIEWMAHAAIHNNPGLKFHGFNDLRILKGVVLEAGQSHGLQVMTGKAFKSGGFHVVPVELSGTAPGGQHFVHARAKMVLAGRLPEAKAPAAGLELPPYGRAMADIYKVDRLFHGPDFQGITRVAGCSADGITALVRPAPLPGQWINQPLRNSWLADPLALDSSFQMMILWSFERYAAASLPVFAGRYRQYRDAFPAAGSEIRVRVTRQSTSKAAAEIDFLDAASGALVARMEDYECVIDASLNESFQRNKLQGAA